LGQPLCSPSAASYGDYRNISIVQSIFSVAARRRKLVRDIADAERRAGALKMDWTEPLHDARPMCIEWLAEG
jgi:hypothetical protein